MGVVKVVGPGQGSRSGDESWFGFKVWVKVLESRLGSRLLSRPGCQGQGSMSWGQGQGHDP